MFLDCYQIFYPVKSSFVCSSYCHSFYLPPSLCHFLLHHHLIIIIILILILSLIRYFSLSFFHLQTLPPNSSIGVDAKLCSQGTALRYRKAFQDKVSEKTAHTHALTHTQLVKRSQCSNERSDMITDTHTHTHTHTLSHTHSFLVIPYLFATFFQDLDWLSLARLLIFII